MVRHNSHFPGLLLEPLLMTTVLVVIITSISEHRVEAGEICSTQALVSEARSTGTDTYQNGTVQIQLFPRESNAKPKTLVLCLIKAGAYCYPRSIELSEFLNYLRKQTFPDSRAKASMDDDDLFYDEPDPDQHEAAMDLELQRQLIESSDALRSVLCVTRNCDPNTHLCSSQVLPEYIWNYQNFNKIRTEIKGRRKEANQSKFPRKDGEIAGGQRMQILFGLTSISSILSSFFVLNSYFSSVL